MASEVLTDFEIAKRLHEELNGSGATDDDSEENERRNVFEFGDGVIVVLSDDDEPPVPPPAPSRNRSRSPLDKNRVTCDNQQAITIQRERKSQNDFFLPVINTFIDLNYNQEWSVVNMQSNLQQMFDKMKFHYFSKWLKLETAWKLSWDTTGIISDDSNFKIFADSKKVLVKDESMVRSRVQLVSILFHVLIHIFLSLRSKDVIKLNHHDVNFREIMLWVNKTMSLQVSTFHKFIDREVDATNCWWQCTGICSSYEPFHGTIRCTTVPDESQTFWKGHEEVCGGQFFKIFEMSRKNPETNEEEKKYVRNVRYIHPKPREPARKTHPKATTQVRELFDLTDETEDAKVQNLCDVIDLDSSEYNVEISVTSSSFVSEFIKQPSVVFMTCPFCEIIIGATRLAQHFDKCRGYQQKVVFNATKKR